MSSVPPARAPCASPAHPAARAAGVQAARRAPAQPVASTPASTLAQSKSSSSPHNRQLAPRSSNQQKRSAEAISRSDQQKRSAEAEAIRRSRSNPQKQKQSAEAEAIRSTAHPLLSPRSGRFGGGRPPAGPAAGPRTDAGRQLAQNDSRAFAPPLFGPPYGKSSSFARRGADLKRASCGAS